MPNWVQEEPPQFAGDDFYLKAFRELGTCRQVGFSLGPIPWRDAVAYAERAGLEPDMVDVFWQVMQEMDVGYLDWHAAEQEKSSKREPKKQKPGPPRRDKSLGRRG